MVVIGRSTRTGTLRCCRTDLKPSMTLLSTVTLDERPLKIAFLTSAPSLAAEISSSICAVDSRMQVLPFSIGKISPGPFHPQRTPPKSNSSPACALAWTARPSKSVNSVTMTSCWPDLGALPSVRRSMKW